MILHSSAVGALAGVPVLPAAALAATAILYVRGVSPGFDPSRAFAFLAGWLLAGIAVVSPLHAAGESRLFAHMIQHVLLLSSAAPLLVWSRPAGALLRGLPLRASRAMTAALRAAAPVRRWLTGAAAATALQAIVLWVWHMPGLYEAGVRSAWVHGLQHGTLFGVALLFWTAVRMNSRAGAALVKGIAALFVTTLHMGILSALFAFSRVAWYDVYASGDPARALGDQQVAGLIMWVPGSAPYVAVALLLLWRLLRQPAQQGSAQERHRAAIPVSVVRATIRPVILCTALGAALMSAGCERPDWEEGAAIAGGDPRSGRVLIDRYGCITCHVVPGVPGGNAKVGPELSGVKDRVYLAGVVTNSPANLIRWIQDPQSIDSLTAMPDLGVTEAQARDIASYLYSLR